MNIAEKVAYLRGLLNGLSFDDDSKEAKVFKAIIDALDEIAMAITDLKRTRAKWKNLFPLSTKI